MPEAKDPRHPLASGDVRIAGEGAGREPGRRFRPRKAGPRAGSGRQGPYERLKAGEAAVSLQDAAALMRLSWQIGHDQAIAARDRALAQSEMFRRGMETALWMARKHIESIDPARWRSFMDDLRRESEMFAGPDPHR